MQLLLDALHSGESFSAEQVQLAVAWLADPDHPPAPKAHFLQTLRQKGETAHEIAHFASALLALAVDPQIPHASLPGPTLDVCGTGGDRLELFNISTASMFVLAAGGVVVLKHGNRAITSQCGGADVLEALGVPIDLPPHHLRECVLRLGLGFLFAPSYHPAFRTIAPARKLLAEKGLSSVFNLLGPLLNPAKPQFQLVGIFSKDQLPSYAQALQLLGRTRAWAIHGGGADELTLAGPSEAIEVLPTALRPFQIDPAQLHLPPAPNEALKGGSRTENAALLQRLLAGEEPGPKSEVVALNAAAGFVVSGLCHDLPQGLALAKELLENGRALAKLQALQNFHP
jgi:anthranilate phosphoribosyltransferase